MLKDVGAKLSNKLAVLVVDLNLMRWRPAKPNININNFLGTKVSPYKYIIWIILSAAWCGLSSVCSQYSYPHSIHLIEVGQSLRA